MLFLPKATRARNRRSRYRLLLNKWKKNNFILSNLSQTDLRYSYKIIISWPLSFKTQLRPQQLDDLAHGLIDITLLNASHKTLQELHSEELAFFTQPGANQGVCTCREPEIKVTPIKGSFTSITPNQLWKYCTDKGGITNRSPELNYAWFSSYFICIIQFTCKYLTLITLANVCSRIFFLKSNFTLWNKLYLSLLRWRWCCNDLQCVFHRT